MDDVVDGTGDESDREDEEIENDETAQEISDSEMRSIQAKRLKLPGDQNSDPDPTVGLCSLLAMIFLSLVPEYTN